jgi:hypothetical protein
VSNKTQGRKVVVSKKKLNGWDAAINHAKERIRQLKLSIQVFQTRRNAGESWPSAGAESKN